MLTHFYSKSEPISFISLLLLLLAYMIAVNFGTPFLGFSLLLDIAGRFVFFTVFVFLAQHIITSTKVTRSTHYALFVFVILIGIYNTGLTVSKISFSSLFILLSMLRLYSLYEKKRQRLKLFDAGLFLGIAFLLYPLSILYIIVIYVGYSLYIKTIEKELLIPIIGFLTPLFLLFSYHYVFGNMQEFITTIELNIGFSVEKIDTLTYHISFGVLFLLLIYSIYKNIGNHALSDSENKQSEKLVIIHLIISLLLVVFYNLNVAESIQFIFFPAAVLVGNMIDLLQKKWVKEALLMGLLIFSFASPFWIGL